MDLSFLGSILDVARAFILSFLVDYTFFPAVSSGSEIGFRSVLQGSTSFFSTDANQTLTINELGQTVSSNSSITVKAIKFAMIDLDSDSERV